MCDCAFSFFTRAVYFSLRSIRAVFCFVQGLKKENAFTPWRRAQLIIVELLLLPSASLQYPVPASGLLYLKRPPVDFKFSRAEGALKNELCQYYTGRGPGAVACGAHGVLRAGWGSCSHKCGDSALQDNPSMFTNPLQLEIEYECLVNLEDGARLNSFQLFCCTFQCSIAVPRSTRAPRPPRRPGPQIWSGSSHMWAPPRVTITTSVWTACSWAPSWSAPTASFFRQAGSPMFLKCPSHFLKKCCPFSPNFCPLTPRYPGRRTRRSGKRFRRMTY